MRSVSFVIGAIIAAAAWAPAQPLQTFRIIPVVGHWTTAAEGGDTIVTADGARWDGTSGPDLAALGRRLFTAPDAAFTTTMAPATAFPFAVVDNIPSFSEGTLRGRFKLIGGASDQIAGLAFGLQPNGDYYYVRYNTKDGNLAVWQFSGGKRSVLQHGAHHAQLRLNQWHELVVTVDGRRVRGEMKGGFTVAYELPGPVAGRVGLWAKRDAVTAFTGVSAVRQPGPDAGPVRPTGGQRGAGSTPPPSS